MQTTRPLPFSTGFAFMAVVLSSIGTAAGGLILLASFFFGADGRESLPAGRFFQDIRLFALALTGLSATVLVVALGHFNNADWARDSKLRLALGGVALLTIFGLLWRTLAW